MKLKDKLKIELKYGLLGMLFVFGALIVGGFLGSIGAAFCFSFGAAALGFYMYIAIVCAFMTVISVGYIVFTLLEYGVKKLKQTKINHG